jgi:PBSX family phage portal protein
LVIEESEDTFSQSELVQAYRTKSGSTIKLSGEEADFDVFKTPGVRKMSGLDKNFIRRKDRELSKAYTSQSGKVKSKQINVDDMYGYDYLECITPPYNMDYLAKLYDISPAHMAAVDAKVESVFGLGYDWIETKKTKNVRQSVRSASGLKKLDKVIQESRDNIELWLEDTNKEDVWEEIMRKIGRDYETMGNAFLEIGRDAQGRIGYLGHLPAKYVRVRRNRDGFVQIFGNRVAYFRNFGDKTSNPIGNDPNPNEVIHFKKYSPNDNYYGIPNIISAKNALAGNEFASRYNLDYFENKAIPRHVIITKGAALSATAMNTLVEFFETGLRGQHHRSVYVPLGSTEAEIEFHSIEAGKQDSSFGDFREQNNEEIFMAHRIPSTRAGVFSGKNTSLAASKDADKVFKESYSRPEQAIFEKKMRRVFKEITDVVQFKLNELSLVDEDTQSQIDDRNIKNGSLVPDEARAKRGLPARPDGKGNEPMVMTAQQEADQKANSMKTRERDTQRANNKSDSANATSGRNAKGEGRKTP